MPGSADFTTDRDAYRTIGLSAHRDFEPGVLEVEFLVEPARSSGCRRPDVESGHRLFVGATRFHNVGTRLLRELTGAEDALAAATVLGLAALAVDLTPNWDAYSPTERHVVAGQAEPCLRPESLHCSHGYRVLTHLQLAIREG